MTTSRRVLADTVVGSGAGHRVRIDLACSRRTGCCSTCPTTCSSLLDVSADGLRPIVTAADLPTISRSERPRADRAPSGPSSAIEERWAASAEHQRRLQVARDAATEALERARRNADRGRGGRGRRASG